MAPITPILMAEMHYYKLSPTICDYEKYGECMMHVDKNADGHVLDVDQISREIAYVPLNGRIRFKRSSCMQPFFLGKEKKNEYKTCLPVV